MDVPMTEGKKMSELLDIKTYPEDILKVSCEDVKKITDWEIKLMDNMLYTMYATKGIGLAAPQIGIGSKVIVIDVGNGPVKLINPVVEEREGSGKMVEGCLSLPGIEVEVNRPYKVLVKGIDLNEKEIKIEAEGLLARVLQHEIDHLTGKLLIDYMNIFQRILLEKKIKRNEK